MTHTIARILWSVLLVIALASQVVPAVQAAFQRAVSALQQVP